MAKENEDPEKSAGPAIAEAEHEPTPLSELEKQYSGGDPTDKPETPAKEEIEGEAVPAGEGDEEIPAAEGESEDVDPELLEQAKALGFTEEEIGNFGSNAVLQKVVDKATAQAAAVIKPAEVAKPAEPDFKIDLDPKDYDEKVVAALNGMNAHYAKKFADLDKAFQAKLDAGFAPVKAYQQEQHFLTVNQAFDTMATEQPEIKALIGTGTVNGTAQGKMRAKIYDQAVIIESGHIAAGKNPPPIKTMLTQAAQIVLGPQLKTIATNKVRSAVTERRTQFLSRGTPHSLSSEKGKSGEERARAAVAARLKELGEDDE